MHGVSPIVAEILVVAITVAAVLAGYAWISSMQASLQGESASSASVVTALPLRVETAVVTTPYTWEIMLRNPNDEDVNISTIKSYLKDHRGVVCAVSQGFITDSNIIPARGVKKVLFYGWNQCKIPGRKEEWVVFVSDASGLQASQSTVVSSRVLGLVLWMPFESVWDFDWSGNGYKIHYYDEKFQGTIYGIHNGTLYNGPQWMDGVKGKALGFDGTDDYVEVPDAEDLHFDGTDSFTIAGWFMLSVLPPTKGTNEVIIYKDRDFLVRADAWDDKLHFWVWDGTDWEPRATSATVLEANNWYFFAAVYDAGSLKLYLNGVLEGTSSNTKASASNNPILIGKPFGDIDGIIDDIRIYNRALSEEEVQKLYRGEDVREGLVLYLPFDEGEGTTAYDWHNWSEEGIWFDGDGDYVEIPDSPELRVTNKKTIIILMNPYPFTENRRGIIQKTSYSHEFAINIHSDGAIDYYDGNGTAYFPGWRWLPPGTVEFNTWNFIAFVRDGNTLYGYKNGELVKTAQTDLIPIAGTGALKIGETYLGDQFGFIGKIKEIRIYNRALSAEEIKCIYEDPDCLTDDENLVVMYTFREPCTTYYPDTRRSTNKVCRAPQIRKDTDGKRYVEFNEMWNNEFWIEGSDFQMPQSAFSIVVNTAITKDLNGPQYTMVRKQCSFLLDGWYANTPTFNVWNDVCTFDAPGIGYGSLTVGKWYTIGGVAEVGQRIRGFRNGAVIYGSGTVTSIGNRSEYPLGIGNWLSEWYDGKMKNLLMFPRPLTTEELNALCKLFGTC